ncbi:hypothetical protein A3K64_00015 [Candidatus Micrarchaeota archaeon RBG_16_36_9]|nr:MAG: hypothetical protein A3K64_00015 [Candidatus Micrarchaeota archaeon RBG_16_36_9]
MDMPTGGLTGLIDKAIKFIMNLFFFWKDWDRFSQGLLITIIILLIYLWFTLKKEQKYFNQSIKQGRRRF